MFSSWNLNYLTGYRVKCSNKNWGGTCENMMHMQIFFGVQFHAIWFVKLPYLLPQPNWVAVRSRKKHSLPFCFHLFGLFWAHQSNGHQHLEKLKVILYQIDAWLFLQSNQNVTTKCHLIYMFSTSFVLLTIWWTKCVNRWQSVVIMQRCLVLSA